MRGIGKMMMIKATTSNMMMSIIMMITLLLTLTSVDALISTRTIIIEYEHVQRTNVCYTSFAFLLANYTNNALNPLLTMKGTESICEF